jgi:hypothetical protein
VSIDWEIFAEIEKMVDNEMSSRFFGLLNRARLAGCYRLLRPGASAPQPFVGKNICEVYDAEIA